MPETKINTKPDRLTFHRDSASNGWRWRVQSANGKIIGASSEGYGRIEDMIANAARLLGRSVIAGDLHLAKSERTHQWDWEEALRVRYGQAHAEEYGADQ